MDKHGYSDELANIVKNFLIEDDWNFSFDESIGLFNFELKVQRKIQRINYLVDIHKDEIVVYGLCPIGADRNDADMMARMAEFLCRVNYDIPNGCFEFDFRDGEIRFRSYIDCENTVPSKEVIRNSIFSTAIMYGYYASGIADIIFSDCTAKEAIAKCEKFFDNEDEEYGEEKERSNEE